MINISIPLLKFNNILSLLLEDKISLLKKEQVNGNNCINFFRVYGKKSAATDFAVLLGAIVGHRSYGYSDLNYGRTAAWSLIDDYYGDTYIININGYIASNHANKRINGIRPIIPLDIVPKNLFAKILSKIQLKVQTTHNNYSKYCL